MYQLSKGVMRYKVLVNSTIVFESPDILRSLTVFSKYIELEIVSNKLLNGVSSSVELYMDNNHIGDFTLKSYE